MKTTGIYVFKYNGVEYIGLKKAAFAFHGTEQGLLSNIYKLNLKPYVETKMYYKGKSITVTKR